MRLVVASQNAPWAARFLQMMQAEAIAAEDHSDAVDLDAEQTTCPACESEFDPRSLAETGGRCPGCGLQLGG